MKADRDNVPGQAQAGDATAQEAGSTSDRTVAADPDQKEGPERIGQVSSLDDIPAVAAYLKRIGATAINFWSARVTRIDAHGYPETIGRVDFERNGTVSVNDEADPPTDEEREAITAAFARVDFPKLITLKAIAEPPPGVNLSDRNVWVCNDFTGDIAMVLQRYETKDGGKGYISWTRWSDGLWRKMEPDTLPFFGLPGFREKSTLVVHEGAKAAARLKRLRSGAESADRFPWFADLEHAHHIGWLGGTKAIQRSDWDKLAAHGWLRVVIVADNDEGGLKAARRIASKFSTNVEILAFDERFDDRFDLGDPWPADLFDERGRHIGPAMRDCLIPATQATVLVPPPPGQRGAPTKVLRD